MARPAHERRVAHARGTPNPRPGGSLNLRIFNTLTRRVEDFRPLVPGTVRMYTCGPTVYRFIHIGNLRSFVMADWLRRTFMYLGFAVTQVKNITDVGHMRLDVLDRGEDKLIAQARKEGKSPWEIAAFYTEAFHTDEAKLRILPADIFPRATDHIAEMLAMTTRLLERGNAYRVGGNVFFSVKTFPDYGRLSGNLLEFLGEGQHAASELDALKRAPEDFPLWKEAEEGRIMAWESPWGRGFPGWHIECSAMSAKYLGPQLDIHTGGVDNVFPHHEDERAQSEAASGLPFVRYWVHGQHLLADGLKMAKSTGNAYTLSDVEARGYEPLALRYCFTTAKYRSRINFTFRALRAAQVSLRRLRERAFLLAVSAGGQAAEPVQLRDHPYAREFRAALCDDLNLPVAMAVTLRMLRDEAVLAATRLALLYDFDHVLGFGLAEDVTRSLDRARTAQAQGRPVAPPDALDPADVPIAVLADVEARSRLRAQADYAAADDLRRRIATAGYDVRDARHGSYLVARGDEEELLTSWRDLPSRLDEPDRFSFSVNLIAHNSRADLERCVESVRRHAGSRAIELVIVDNGSTDDTLAYLKQLAADGAVGDVPVRLLFADHNLGFAAARNAAYVTSLGGVIVALDTSIELAGDIWEPIERALADPTAGLVGPFGLVTGDLKEFAESAGPDVDAVEGYLMAFRRRTLREVGPAYDKFRFYRLMDIDLSLEFKKAGYRVLASQGLAARVIRHAHREWESLSAEDRATKSKKNFDLYYKRRHHSQSLLVAHYVPGQQAPWGHDHELPLHAADARFEHTPLPEGAVHTHEHKHWPDHAHTHTHTHQPRPRWLARGVMAQYQPHGAAEQGREQSEAEDGR